MGGDRLDRGQDRLHGGDAALLWVRQARELRQANETRRKASARAHWDVPLKPEIARGFAEKFAVHGARKVWRQRVREGFGVARCTGE